MKPGRRSVNRRVPSSIAKPSVAVVVAALGLAAMLAAMACSASNVVEQPVPAVEPADTGGAFQQPATGPTVTPGAPIVPPETNAGGKLPQPTLNGGPSSDGLPSPTSQAYVAPASTSPSLSTNTPQPSPVTPVAVAGAASNQGQFDLDDAGSGALHAAATTDESVPSQQLGGNEVEGNEGEVQGLNLPAKKQRKYPNLSTYLHQLVVDLEAGRTDAQSADGDASPHGQDGQPVAVTIFLSGHVDEVVAFLEDNGGDPRNVGEDYIEAYMPVALLGPVSQRPGVSRIREIIPPRPGQAPPVSIP